jgi:hypothetical protein
MNVEICMTAVGQDAEIQPPKRGHILSVSAPDENMCSSAPALGTPFRVVQGVHVIEINKPIGQQSQRAHPIPRDRRTGGPNEDVLVNKISACEWRVTDCRYASDDARSLLGVITEGSDKFETLSFETRSTATFYDSLEEAVVGLLTSEYQRVSGRTNASRVWIFS